MRTPPPRWPYRRHVSATLEANYSISSPHSSLPSIGSFFDSSASSPAGSLKSPLPNLASSPQPSFQFGSRLSATSPSPSALPLEIHSPFTSHESGKNFSLACANVKTEPRYDPYAYFSEPSEEHRVPLKSYACPSSRHAMNEVKQEPVETGFTARFDQAKTQSMISSPVQQREVFSDAEENFHDPDIGGVAVAPAHGSVS